MGCCINCRNNCAWSLTRERAERLRSLKTFIAFQENLMGNSHFNGSWSTFRFSFFFSCTHDNPRRWVWVGRGGVYAMPPCACCCCCCAQLPGARPDELTSRGAAIKRHRQAPHINALNFGRVAAAAGNNNSNYSKWHMCMWHTHTQSQMAHTLAHSHSYTPQKDVVIAPWQRLKQTTTTSTSSGAGADADADVGVAWLNVKTIKSNSNKGRVKATKKKQTKTTTATGRQQLLLIFLSRRCCNPVMCCCCCRFRCFLLTWTWSRA